MIQTKLILDLDVQTGSGTEMLPQTIGHSVPVSLHNNGNFARKLRPVTRKSVQTIQAAVAAPFFLIRFGSRI